MKEKKIEEYLRNEIKKIGGTAYKFVSPGNNGVPDRLVLLPKGNMIFVELKSENGKLTKLQELQIKKLNSLGNEVWIINSKKGVDEFINYCKGLISGEVQAI